MGLRYDPETKTTHIDHSIWEVARSAPGDDSIIPRGRLVNVSFNFIVPQAASRAEIEEWVQLALGCGGCGADNPLFNEPLDACNQPVLTDLGLLTDSLDLHEEALEQSVQRTAQRNSAPPDPPSNG